MEDSRNRLDDLFASGNNEKAMQMAFAMLSTGGSQTGAVSGSPPNNVLLTITELLHLDDGHAVYMERKDLFLKRESSIFSYECVSSFPVHLFQTSFEQNP